MNLNERDETTTGEKRTENSERRDELVKDAE